MKITVKIYQGDTELLSKIFGEGSFRAGRSEFCDIVLGGDNISRSHFELRVTPASVYMTNMSGAGRVKVNGERVETAEIHDGDTLLAGNYRIVVFHGERDVEAPAPAAAESADGGFGNPPTGEPPSEENAAGFGFDNNGEAPAASNEPPAEEVPPALEFGNPQDEGQEDPLKPLPFGKVQPEEDYAVEGTAALARSETVVEPKPLVAKLIFTEGPRKGEELLLETYEVIMGRSRKADIFLDDEKLSRQHAKIARMGMGYRLIDLNSRNGTFVNGMRILEHPLNSFDVVELGATKIKFLIHDLGMQEVKGGLTLIKNPNEQTKSVAVEDGPQVELQQLHQQAQVGQPQTFGAEPKAPKNNRVKLYLAIIGLLAATYFLVPSEEPQAPETANIVAPKQLAPLSQGRAQEGPAAMPSLPKEYNDLTAEMQRKIEGYYNTASRSAERKDFEQAILQLKKIHEVLPYYKGSRDQLEQYAKRLKEVQAERAKDKANQADRDLQIYLEDGQSYLKEGDFDKATESFRLALNVDPRNDIAIKGLKAAEAKVKSFEEIPPERDPEQEKIDQVKDLFEKAIAAFKTKSYQEAIDNAEKIRVIELRNNTQYLNEAKQIIDRAKMLQKEEFEPFLIQAKEKYAEGDYNSARDLCEEMLKRDPAYEDAKDLLGKTKKQLNKLAKEAYTTGYILESMNRIEEAKQYWNRAKNYVRPGDEYHPKVLKKLDQYQ